jgi:hypothetical protein
MWLPRSQVFGNATPWFFFRLILAAGPWTPNGPVGFRVQRFPRGPSSAIRPVELNLGSLSSMRPATAPPGPICAFLDCATTGVALGDITVSDNRGTQIFDPRDSNMLLVPLDRDPLGANMLSNTAAKTACDAKMNHGHRLGVSQ